jgi:hypothetical protein
MRELNHTYTSALTICLALLSCATAVGERIFYGLQKAWGPAVESCDLDVFSVL